MVASIHNLPDKDWNAHAVAGDILERCPIDSQIMALWVDEDGKVRYSKTNLGFSTVAMFAAVLQEFATQRIRGFFD